MSGRLALIARLGAALERESDSAQRALLSDALEAIVEAVGEFAVLERRRAKDRRRKQPPSAISTESTESALSTESADSTHSTDSADSSAPPPSSSSFPGPHITPPSPPSVLPASQPVDPRARLNAVLDRFVSAMDQTAAFAWRSRVAAAIDRDGKAPDPVADALEELMANKPPTDWTPVLFRAYVGRLARAAAAEESRDSVAQAARATAEGDRAPRAASNGNGNGTKAEAAEAFAQIRELIEEEHVTGQSAVQFIRPAALEALGPRYVRAVRHVGGVRRIIADVVKSPERIGLLLKDFTEAWSHPTPEGTTDG